MGKAVTLLLSPEGSLAAFSSQLNGTFICFRVGIQARLFFESTVRRFNNKKCFFSSLIVQSYSALWSASPAVLQPDGFFL